MNILYHFACCVCSGPSGYNLFIMNEKPSFRPYLIPTLLLAAGGWAGLYALMQFTLPTLWPRWGFYALLVLALTGTAIPLSYLYNAFLSSQPIGDPKVIIRQAMWVGFYGALLAWLQLGRVLTFGLAVAIGAGVAAIEYAIRLMERAQSAQSQEKGAAPSEPPQHNG